jgi:hypothetical protein
MISNISDFPSKEIKPTKTLVKAKEWIENSYKPSMLLFFYIIIELDNKNRLLIYAAYFMEKMNN